MSRHGFGILASTILNCHRTMHGGIRSKPWAFAAVFPKRCLMPSSDMRPLRSDVVMASLRLRTRLKSCANFHGTNDLPRRAALCRAQISLDFGGHLPLRVR